MTDSDLKNEEIKKGLFIVFEGIDNCGKSTQAKKAEEYLISLGREVVRSREPGGTKLGEELRRILKSNEFKNEISPESEVFLFCAARREFSLQRVKIEIELGKDFISDRYKYSTVAYQGARGLDLDLLTNCNNYATRGVEADLVVLVDRDAKEAILSKPESERDRFEQSVDYMKKVRENYLRMAGENPFFKVVNYADNDVEGMFAQVKNYLDDLISGI